MEEIMKKIILAMVVVLSGFGILFADNYRDISSGKAALTCRDGRQTVHFSNGASYTGDFYNCRPVSGQGTYRYNGQVFSGYFSASGSSVSLEQNGYKIILKVTSSRS